MIDHHLPSLIHSDSKQLHIQQTFGPFYHSNIPTQLFAVLFAPDRVSTVYSQALQHLIPKQLAIDIDGHS